ncbi:hypothetical protein PTTG_01020 [Puccinia triticina 1-1 BBBD Race 1]|uniref:Ino eighty subunit 1 n=2 Tax=Puccinia triticina TaxID=208348 RepID=A0A180GUV3_PUCT1|nr:uncharacterized protein PtA15_3A800 [Puccinia triticina]OAV96586.1 hypothetical protein PTTG_01020 [Puccinia triticina 1-1 BBBD Race 1]WAQ83430.1 hypothetical protein PtA15_3A800 [Puccinia triticina]
MAPPKKNRANQANSQATPSTSKENSGWALKKLDGEMFTREDIQYDLMSNIFNDRTFQFTSPLDQRAISFKELYVETLSRFSKAAKSTVRQLDDNPQWATNFCIASFLINIGRINTTVAFYPELRAYMRTYHPIPCLQKDEYCQTNLQDAPRIKTMLKSCQLPSEFNNEPESLPDIAKRSALGYRPPTTVVNLIFELFGVEPYVSMKYFPEGFVLHDLFSPNTIPTKLRAYAFLWLMHHFLEDPSVITDFQHESKIEAFQIARLEDIQPDSSLGDSPENVDTEEEIKWGKDMQNYRREFLKKWRGEEGIGFVDDLGTGSIAPLIEDSQLTKKQKIMVQNYAQTSAIEGDDRQTSQAQLVKGSTPGSSIPPSALMGSGKSENRKGTAKESGGKHKTVWKTRMSHTERLQTACDAQLKYGNDDHFDGPEDSLTQTQIAWRRYQTDVAEDFDVAYDSDDLIRQPNPTWKPKELKQRLLCFAFPTPAPTPCPMDYEPIDKVIWYIGRKPRDMICAEDVPSKADGNSNKVGRKGPSLAAGEGGGAHEAGPSASGVPPNQASTAAPKLKRKRKANQPPPNPAAAQAPHPSLQLPSAVAGPPKTDPDQPPQLHPQGSEVPIHMLSRPPA